MDQSHGARDGAVDGVTVIYRDCDLSVGPLAFQRVVLKGLVGMDQSHGSCGRVCEEPSDDGGAQCRRMRDVTI